MNDFRAELLAAFAAEHREHLAAIRAALSAEDEDGAVTLEPAALREVFRRVHSLKGAARAVDLPALEAVAHRLETLLAREGDAAGGGAARLAPSLLALLHQGLDAIEAQAAAMAGGTPPPPVEAVLAALDAGPGGTSALPLPPSQDQSAGPPPAPGEAKPAPESLLPAEGYLRVEASRVERLSATMLSLKSLIQRQDSTGAGLREVEGELRALRRGWEGLRTALPVDPALAPRLRGFEAALGEVLRHVSALSRHGRAIEDAMDRAARALREEVEAIALVPAGTVLGSLAAAARGMAREAGREVTVRTEGMEVQAERRVLQALKDPVLHLLRNALGHGAPRDGRRAEIGLRVAATGGGLTITVWDNGPGPDLAAIEATATRRALLPARAPDTAPPPADTLLGLVFEPGFSTASEVDSLSGRGMGLSVVAEAAMALHGGAAMRPRPEGGTEVVIALPPSTGRQTLLLLEAGGQVLGLPGSGGLVAVGPLLRLTPAMLTTAEGRVVARLSLGEAEALVPVVALAAVLGWPEGPPTEGPVQAILLTRGGTRLALTVSALRDARSLVVTEVDAPGVDSALVSGAALLEGEAVALVLRPEGLLHRGLREANRPGARVAGPAPGRRQRHVLVVDDSITTRTLERSILEAGGYRVTLAVDGVDALNSLREPGAVIDLILADVEMPRMDGFGLLEAVRADPALAGLPVILMTSRDSPGDVQRGMELGATAYLTKQGFDQQALLAAIGQLI
ncbi:hybrid sensor histidine kinase/response regulator [Roseomonas xinghualingensis]|uniref:hybrid sensor histidine kinase/response regulator n=1 Tax=Roseomonas xinghualingensis TaxID=2986475 RepID=UPI0021F18A53|nr:response regulator [Roseomonas sp. SXEYE001]MCV4208789.1 response regulator [Roseomonas sp. SXEYE001]